MLMGFLLMTGVRMGMGTDLFIGWMLMVVTCILARVGMVVAVFMSVFMGMIMRMIMRMLFLSMLMFMRVRLM